MRVIPRSRPLLAALLAALLATAVLLGLPTVATTSRAGAAAVPRYDGDALLRGTFFDLGPVAKQYPKLVLGDIAQPERNATLVSRLLAQAELSEPGFRGRFAAAMYSRDRPRIQRAAVDTSNTLIAALLVLYPDAAGDWTSGDGTVTATAVYQFVDANANVVVDTISLILDLGVVSETGHGVHQDLKLRLEQWAQQVATTLTGA
ncbi:hypothetical protein [Dactylosporangium sp. NPDC005555]|uniref:hypothetical protein n=1 Tax=Dactylosporangium sp. NPDC005555 TaxID=3154889 RepID=UPI0033ABABB1